MSLGIGGTSREAALASLAPMLDGVAPIALPEYRERIARAQALMREQGIAALYLHAGTSLRYFTGLVWRGSERLVGALLPAQGEIEYLAPAFEEGTIRGYQVLPGAIRTWHEHENPYTLLRQRLEALDPALGRRAGLCESTPFFVVDGLREAGGDWTYVNAKPVTAACRMRKSDNEIALMQRAHDMTLAVHRATASMLHEGITAAEVDAFVDAAHRKVGAAGSYFCIVLFGADSAFPHGVKQPKPLARDEVVLIDTGCLVHGYMSDITRSYVFGTPSARQRAVWEAEKTAQAAAFAAARIGASCESVDQAARASLEANGFGPGYALPGLPHRTGHGIGLDIHEWPYLVGGDRTPLAPGMCFSNEPMICVPGEFGIRHEDHFYMTVQGPRWFTQPAHSIDDPFGIGAR
ncbi:MAG TPA: Xaa-Pro peptidase family protein [Tahibacter sp.]|uniref:M24 family metallopeptidase n=1 Tax=Tahibacter sp. TaxID=2056211 RepID=UPI002BF727DB|nr:Xaa-Pro peptidase family protein [Tahibacter sp.]HSX62947.1 Xaa-Pro peptidase family protein [Tahibacter sp.]